MKKFFFSKWLKTVYFFLLFALLLYGMGRLYYKVTGGFTIGNISSTLSYDKRWQTHIPEENKQKIDAILSQKFTYLGKGCQSYVFISDDGQYVLKFFKYQRFRPQFWLPYLTFIPWVDQYYNFKIEQKKEKLEKIFRSWKIAYEELPEQTGVVFIHLNKESDFNQTLLIKDKMGFDHQLDAGQMEFLVQKRADMLCPTLDRFIEKGDIEGSKHLLDRLIVMIHSEYLNGYADNDHALMQNTGVIDGRPVHIDVGQFIYNDLVKDPGIYHQELYNKTFKFRHWLRKKNASLADHLEMRLKDIIGVNYTLMKPYVHQGDVAKIPHSRSDFN